MNLSIITIIFMIIGSLLIVFLLVWLFILKSSKDENYLVHNPFIINFMSQHSHGRAYGIEKDSTKAKGDRTYVEFTPLDIDPDLVDEVKDEKLVVGKGKRVTLPPGTLSKFKTINLYLPPTASDFPDALKAMPFGKFLMYWTEIENSVSAELESVKEGSKRKDKILEQLGDGELSREHLSRLDELQKDIIKMLVSGKNKDKDHDIFTSQNQETRRY